MYPESQPQRQVRGDSGSTSVTAGNACNRPDSRDWFPSVSFYGPLSELLQHLYLMLLLYGFYVGIAMCYSNLSWNILHLCDGNHDGAESGSLRRKQACGDYSNPALVHNFSVIFSVVLLVLYNPGGGTSGKPLRKKAPHSFHCLQNASFLSASARHTDRGNRRACRETPGTAGSFKKLLTTSRSTRSGSLPRLYSRVKSRSPLLARNSISAAP